MHIRVIEAVYSNSKYLFVEREKTKKKKSFISVFDHVEQELRIPTANCQETNGHKSHKQGLQWYIIGHILGKRETSVISSHAASCLGPTLPCRQDR